MSSFSARISSSSKFPRIVLLTNVGLEVTSTLVIGKSKSCWKSARKPPGPCIYSSNASRIMKTRSKEAIKEDRIDHRLSSGSRVLTSRFLYRLWSATGMRSVCRTSCASRDLRISVCVVASLYLRKIDRTGTLAAGNVLLKNSTILELPRVLDRHRTSDQGEAYHMKVFPTPAIE
jgi:hypothetical protein